MQEIGEIHIAQAADFSRLVEIWERSVRATHHFLQEQDIDQLRPLILQQYLPHLQVYSIILHDKICGFIGVDQQKLEMLFIDANARGQGFGTQLLDYAIQQFAITAVDVNEQNPQAVGFYLAHGFQIAGRSEQDGQGRPYPLLHLEFVG
ncbi:acetyltransferase [Acinetobacter puyangensis]|uniref:acetyltransferase n=1 Tax=Acinetobacter puyangensis TaxID=1096779 RepID=UPI003A4DE5E0